MRIRKYAHVLIWLLFIIPISNYILVMTIGETNMKLFEEIEVSILYLFTFFYSGKKYGILSIQSLFLFALGFFSLSGVVGTVLGIADYTIKNYNTVIFEWTDETTVIVLNYYLIFLLLYFIYLYSKNPFNIEQRDLSTDYNQIAGKIGVSKCSFVRQIMIISFPFALIYHILYAISLRNTGRYILYANGYKLTGGINLVIKLLELVFLVSYSMLCVYESDAKRFDKFSVMYLAVFMTDFIGGARAEAVSKVLFFLYFRYKRFNSKVKGYKIFAGIILGMLLLSYIGVTRIGLRYDRNNILAELSNFLFGQSGSISIVGYYVQNKDILSHNAYPYIFEPIVKVFLLFIHPGIINGGQNLEVLKYRMSLGHHITYSISPSQYLYGSGVGGNFIAEMSEFGAVSIFVFSIIFLAIMNRFDKDINRRKFARFLAPFFVQFLLIAPRGSAFFDSYSLVKYLIMYIMFEAIFNILNHRNIFS